MATVLRPDTDGRPRLADYPRRNALNAVRLVLAAAVVVDHAYPIGGFGSDPLIGRLSVGAFAVFAFFGISGYLIAGSALNRTGRVFFRARVLRIFPAFWAALLLVALVLCPLAWLYQHDSLTGFPVVADVGYVVKNLLLVTPQRAVGDVLAQVPDANVWNASLWTLPIEFACYALTALAARLGLLQRRAVMVAFAVLLAVSLLALSFAPMPSTVPVAAAVQLGEVLLMFVVGALVRVMAGRVRLDGRAAAVAAGVVAGSVVLSAHVVPLLALPLVYLLLWLGARLRVPRVLRDNDISYGVYVYAMPVQQVLALIGVAAWGRFGFAAVALIAVAVLATVSWKLLEQPALRLRARTRVKPAGSPLSTFKHNAPDGVVS